MTTLAKAIPLDENSPEVDTPERFKLPLYDYQKRVVKKAVDIIQKRYVVLDDVKGIYNQVNDRRPIVGVSNCIRLSDPFGSGKTIMALAILCELPTPKAVVENNTSILGITRQKNNRYYGQATIYNSDRYNEFLGFQTEIYKKYNGVLPFSIIVVGIQVLDQWYEAIKTFTDFKVFKIGGFYSLEQFYKMFKTGVINNFDIVLIKNGAVTGNFCLDSESTLDSNRDSRPIINVVEKMLNGFCVRWVIYDDFDTIRIPSNTRGLSALATMYMSTSNNHDDCRIITTIARNERATKKLKQYPDIIEMVRANLNPRITDAVYDTILNHAFNIRCDPDFIERSLQLPVYFAYECVYSNPNDKYIRLLGKMGTNDAMLVMEGLNADAVNYVAEAVGIKTDPTPASIFQKLLQNEFEKYEHDCLVLEVLDLLEEKYNTADLPIHPKLIYSISSQGEIVKKISSIAKSWKKVKVRDFKLEDVVQYSSSSVEKIINETREEYQIKKSKDGRAIENVKENLREGDCQICCCPLEDIVIARCCTVTICGICLKNGFRLRTILHHQSKERIIIGNCPNCMKEVNFATDLIYVTHGFNLDEIETATGTEVLPDSPPRDETDDEKLEEQVEDEYETENPKLRALYDIMRRKMPESCKPIEYRVANLLVGKVEKHRSDNEPIKMIAYAGYDDCLQLMQKYMTKKNIKWFQLGGTFSEITRIKNNFRDYTGDAILFINSNKICAGMNLEFATDGFTYHSIINEDVEAQIAGRWQRVGRTCSFKLWNIRYVNESAY